MTDKPTWLSAFPFLQNQWSAVAALTQRYPQPESLEIACDWQDFLSVRSAKTPVTDWFNLLREYRQSRLAYFAWHDWQQPIADHQQTMTRVSALADHMVAVAYGVAQVEMQQRHGVVHDAQGHAVELLVYALGKLGTRELNYSSDIDLVMIYADEGESDGERPLAAAKYFTRMGQKIIKLLDHFTPAGRVYRVDMRLRPFGSAAPLVCHTAAFHQYLLYEGREWERFAWMRARLLVGPEVSHQEVMQALTPFIYRKHLDYTVFQSLLKIKTEIGNHLSYAADDLKQGRGGIRAVEFIVQSMQLVYGGRHPEFRGQSIAEPLNQLIKAGKIPTEDGKALKLAWLWLRKVENICQLVADQDVHEVPDNNTVKQVISEGMGCEDWDECADKLQFHRDWVADQFSQLFDQQEQDQTANVDELRTVKKLMNELPLKRLPQNRLELVEQLLQQAVTEPSVSSAVSLKFAQLIKRILTRPSYLLMLSKEHYLLQKLLQMLARHSYFSEVLQHHPVLLEQLFDEQPFALLDHDALGDIWQQKAPEGDREQWMEQIRQFKLEIEFNTIKAWSDQDITGDQACWQLTQLAASITREVVGQCWHEINDKIPAGELKPGDLMVIAYGSAAENRMSIHSDLDLVFILAGDTVANESRVFAMKWVKRVVHHLTSRLYHGLLYPLDMQLRPNGNSGSLVTTQSEFERYQLEDAWIWEHAALFKTTAWVADDQQKAWFDDVRERVLSQRRDPKEVDKAMQKMAAKMSNQSPNSSHAEEFTVLSAILKHAHKHPEVISDTSVAAAADRLKALGLLSDDTHLAAPKKNPTR